MSPPGVSEQDFAAALQAFAAAPALQVLDQAEHRAFATVQHAVTALIVASGSVSLEPAGQFELSGAPQSTLHETAAGRAGHRHRAAGTA